MVTLHEVITFLVSMQISISSLQTKNVITSCSVTMMLFLHLEVKRSEERFSRNAETDLVCRLLLEKKKEPLRYVRTRAGLSAPSARTRGRGRGSRATRRCPTLHAS